jgi:hypothetical protein
MPVTSLRKTCARPPEVAICGAYTCALEKQEQQQEQQQQQQQEQEQEQG